MCEGSIALVWGGTNYGSLFSGEYHLYGFAPARFLILASHHLQNPIGRGTSPHPLPTQGSRELVHRTPGPLIELSVCAPCKPPTTFECEWNCGFRLAIQDCWHFCGPRVKSLCAFRLMYLSGLFWVYWVWGAFASVGLCVGLYIYECRI